MACSLCRQIKLARKKKKKDLPFQVISKTAPREKEVEGAIADSDIFSTQLVDLPFEVISHIFSKLPIKSLLRCRLVLKQWNLLTRTSQFINLYHVTRIARQPLTFAFPSVRYENGLNSLFVFQKDGETIRIPFEHKLQGRSYFVSSSCNGFLLLRDCYSRIRNCTTQTTPRFIVYNPITKETIVDIPDPPKDADGVSFGFDAKTLEYKLVFQHEYIITLGQTCWRKLSRPCNQLLETLGSSVFVNGAFYWTHRNKNVVISLDICTEKYIIIRFPLQTTLEDPRYCLLEYDNKLAYVGFDCESQQLQIWSLADDQKSTWIHLSTNNITHLLSKHYCKQHKFLLVEQVGNDSLLFYHLDRDADFKCRYHNAYDLQSDWWYRPFIYTPKSGGHVINFTTNRLESWADFCVFDFIPNLALLQNPDRSKVTTET